MTSINPISGNAQIYDLAREKIGLRTVGLAVIDEEIGSATPVRLGDKYGLLTAGHVASYLEVRLKKRRTATVRIFSFNGSSRTQPTHFFYTDAVGIGLGNTSRDGPDIAFIRIDPSFVAALVDGAVTFIDLEQNRILYESLIDIDDGEPRTRFKMTAGLIGEWCAPGGSAGGVCEPGEAHPLPSSPGGHDRLLFVPFEHKDYFAPTTYGGNSGGGLWGVFGKEDEPSIVLLSVVYWQDAKKPSGYRDLVCHGPKTLYGDLLALI
jgi:hypothetical protein